MQTVISVFENTAEAQRAVDRLVEAGFDRNDLHMESASAGGTQGVAHRPDDPGFAMDSSIQARTVHPEGDSGLLGRLMSSLLGDAANEDDAGHHRTYSEALSSGNTLVLVEVADASLGERACALLGSYGATHVHQRSGAPDLA
ncbi:MAG TPA: hypothetical protein VLJ19_19980 [Variovorax sp.]|nr:hypothetical protein [Variovorax sp.]